MQRAKTSKISIKIKWVQVQSNSTPGRSFTLNAVNAGSISVPQAHQELFLRAEQGGTPEC